MREPPEGSTLSSVSDKDAQYEILAVLEFNSTRKRQSVIVRQPDGSILLQCKVKISHRTFLVTNGLALVSVHLLVALLPSDPGLSTQQTQDCLRTFLDPIIYHRNSQLLRRKKLTPKSATYWMRILQRGIHIKLPATVVYFFILQHGSPHICVIIPATDSFQAICICKVMYAVQA